MKILLVADEEDRSLWDYYTPGKLSGIDLILSAGDLKPEYLSFLVTLANRPLYYVHGNHDGIYEKRPPEGCECIDDRLVTVNGVRILGLGGSRKYNEGPYQYTDAEMARRIFKSRFKCRRAGGVDIILTHAPAFGYGDEDNLAHRGFECFLPMMDRYQPKYLVHGHVHKSYGHDLQRELSYGETTIVNCSGKYIIEL